MLTDYHAKYFAHELTKRSASDSIEKLASSLFDAQIDVNPHQVDAALFAFRSPLSKGAILADEVGLGKTIEAGLVISQRWAERKRKILIIVPSSLRKQWNQELLDKFFIPSVILEATSFNRCIKEGNLNPFERKNEIVICSYHFARSKDSYVTLTNWDLVVIDEAHRLRNVYKKTNKIANTIKLAVANRHKILLTATPLQNSLLELYGLVSIIDEHTFGDLQSYKAQFARLDGGTENYSDLKERLAPVCKRTLRRQVLEYIKYTNRTAITQKFEPTDAEQRLYDLVSDYLQRDDLFALPASQRHLMTLILRRLLASSTFAISGTFNHLADKLQKMINDSTPVELFDETLSQEYEPLDDLKDEWLSEEENEEEEKNSPLTEDQLVAIGQEMSQLREFHALAESIKRNSKGEVLLTALQKGFQETHRLGGAKKAVIFTESTRTQQYVQSILEATDFGNKIVLFNGSNNDNKSKEIYEAWKSRHEGTERITGSRTADMRAALVDYFREEAVVMIATEAAAEGINLQFCSLIVNYDLPWNPQRIEQRIGRCHRYGQQHDVVVVNFLNTKNEADIRVFELLDKKFKLFDGVFGASDEVLGTIEAGVDFEKRIAQIYQQCRTQKQIQESFDALQMQLEEQIDKGMQDTRQKLLENFDEEVHEKLRFSKDRSEHYLQKYEQWLWDLTRHVLRDHADMNNEKHEFYLRTNPLEGQPIPLGPYKMRKADEHSHLYRLGHPVAQYIIRKCKDCTLNSVHLSFHYTGTPKISILQDYIGKSGWLCIQSMVINSFESEDHLLIAGITEDGIILDTETCQRLFSLEADVKQCENILSDTQTAIDQILHARKVEAIDSVSSRNAEFFDTEMEKLDKWAEDRKQSLEMQLKELEKNIRANKTEARKLLKLEEKVKMQRMIKEMEKKRREMRQDLYQAQDEVDVKKETLLKEIEKRMQQKISVQTLFMIQWNLAQD